MLSKGAHVGGTRLIAPVRADRAPSASSQKGSKEVLYDIADAGKVTARVTPPEDKQGQFESRRSVKACPACLPACLRRHPPLRVLTSWGARGRGGECRLWSKVSAALLKRDQNVATDEKSAIENYQRTLRAQREKKKIEWTPRFFKQSDDNLDWVSTANMYVVCSVRAERPLLRVCCRSPASAWRVLRLIRSATMTDKQLEAYLFTEVDAVVLSVGNMSLDDTVQASASGSRDIAADLAEDDDQPGGEED